MNQDLSADEWEDAVSRSFVPLRAAALPKGFVGGITQRSLGSSYGVSHVRCGRSELRRTASQANDDSQPSVLFVTHLSGDAKVVQNDRSSRQKAGQSVLYLTDRPYELNFSTSIEELVLQIPVSCLSIRRNRLDELSSRSLQMTMPFKLLRTFMMQLCVEDAGVSSAALGRVAGELLDVALASVDGTSSTPSSGVSFAGIKQFIRAHASDAELDPSMIAAAFHISLRHLYNICAEAGHSPADLIRQRRIEIAQSLLVSELNRPVSALAYDCGFADSSTFSRVFKARTGYTPATYRREHLGYAKVS